MKLYDVLKNVNSKAAELADKKEKLGKIELNLTEANLSLDHIRLELQTNQSSVVLQNKAQRASTSIEKLTSDKDKIIEELSEIEAELDSHTESAFELIYEREISAEKIFNEEDAVVYELQLDLEENEVITNLIDAQEKITEAQMELSLSKQRFDALPSTKASALAQQRYFAAKKALETASEEGKALAAEKLESATAELEAELGGSENMQLFRDCDRAERALREIQSSAEAFYIKADKLPLVTPEKELTSGSGVISQIIRAEQEAADTDPDVAAKLAAKKIIARKKRESEDRTTHLPADKVLKLTNELREMRELAAGLKRDAERAKMDTLLIKRAKYMSAISLKKASYAAKRCAALLSSMEKKSGGV